MQFLFNLQSVPTHNNVMYPYIMTPVFFTRSKRKYSPAALNRHSFSRCRPCRHFQWHFYKRILLFSSHFKRVLNLLLASQCSRFTRFAVMAFSLNLLVTSDKRQFNFSPDSVKQVSVKHVRLLIFYAFSLKPCILNLLRYAQLS